VSQEDIDRARLIEERRKEYESLKPVEKPEERSSQDIDKILSEIFDDEDKAEDADEDDTDEDDEDDDDGQKPEPEPKVVERIVEKPVVDDKLVKENEKLTSRISELEERLAEGEDIISDLEDKLENAGNAEPVIQTVYKTVEKGSIDEINDRLAILRERLKLSERELRVNNKEYLPLKRVATTLENDRKKLRRKEAVVAKQKVQLYGVNNYVDIDEEKAKKLAEDLDLLEGLRLSVAHCEEVMTQNKERYPILERTNRILTITVTDLKADIADLEEQLKRLQEDAGNN